MLVLDDSTKGSFLKNDLRNSLKYLFEGAIAWQACKPWVAAGTQPTGTEKLKKPQCAGRHQAVLGMYASFVEARALYAFFYESERHNDDARAWHFASGWKPSETNPYKTYMAAGKPANKRVFHLVYNRELHAGGSAKDESDHLKNQVVEFAKDLRKLTEEFAGKVEQKFRDSVLDALQKAFDEAKYAAHEYGVENPLGPSVRP